jgi:hypothetical protein
MSDSRTRIGLPSVERTSCYKSHFRRKGALSMRRLHEPEYEDMDYGAEMFDPTPPPAGAVLLTRFGFASAALTATHRGIIQQIAADTLAQIARSTWPPLCPVVQISGHEDEPGDPANYGVFGWRRATAVAAALGPLLEQGIARLPASVQLPQGIDVQVSSEGPERPIRSNLTEDGRAMNRRVEVLVLMAECPTA